MHPNDAELSAKSEVGHDEVVRLFDRSDALHEAAGQVLAQTGPPPDRRAFLAISVAIVSLEHWGAQRILLREDLNVSGFAMVRLQFEATIRAVWILECAKDDWLERFSAPVPDGQLEEPVLGPPVEAMLSAIAKKAPDHRWDAPATEGWSVGANAFVCAWRRPSDRSVTCWHDALPDLGRSAECQRTRHSSRSM